MTSNVRPTFRKLFSADGDQVIFDPTGEVVDFAHVAPGTQYLTTRLTDDAKVRAIEVLTGDNVARLMIAGGPE